MSAVWNLSAVDSVHGRHLILRVILGIVLRVILRIVLRVVLRVVLCLVRLRVLILRVL